MEKVKPQEYKLFAGLFCGKRKLRLSPEYFEYENKSLWSKPCIIRVNKEDILDIRHSMNWIIWYRFYVGSDFKIDIKTKDQGVVKIRFTGYFRKINAYAQAYEDIVNWIWEHYFSDVLDNLLETFHINGDITLHSVRLSDAGIHFLHNEQLITWDKVAVKEYQDYFAIYKKDEPEINIRLQFDEWESELLLEMVNSLKQSDQESNKT